MFLSIIVVVAVEVIVAVCPMQNNCREYDFDDLGDTFRTVRAVLAALVLAGDPVSTNKAIEDLLPADLLLANKGM